MSKSIANESLYTSYPSLEFWMGCWGTDYITELTIGTAGYPTFSMEFTSLYLGFKMHCVVWYTSDFVTHVYSDMNLNQYSGAITPTTYISNMHVGTILKNGVYIYRIYFPPESRLSHVRLWSGSLYLVMSPFKWVDTPDGVSRESEYCLKQYASYPGLPSGYTAVTILNR